MVAFSAAGGATLRCGVRFGEIPLFNQLLEAASPRTIQSVLLLALRLIPGLVVILLTTPAFIAYAFVSPDRQKATLALLDRLIRWTTTGDGSPRT